MRQIDMTDAMRSINKAQNVEFLANLDEYFPRQAQAREGDYGIKNSKLRFPSFSLYVADSLAEERYQVCVVNGKSDLYASTCSWRGFTEVTNSLLACWVNARKIYYGVAFRKL